MELQSYLGWEYINVGAWFRSHLNEFGLEIESSSRLPESIHQEFDAKQKNLAENAQLTILEGRLSGWISNSITDIFRVWCYAPENIRVKRYATRERLSRSQALKKIQIRDQGDLLNFQQLYNVVDYRDEQYYHLVLDTTSESPQELARKICSSIGIVVEPKPK